MVDPIDTAVVGGGPAGLAAALSLVRARRRVTVIDAGDPRNRFAPHSHGVLGHDGIPPVELLAKGRAEIEGYGGSVVRGRAEAIRRDGDALVVDGPAGPVRTRRVLVATGLVDELPAVPGVREQWGRGVVVCPYCDGWEHRNDVVGVLATSPHSTEQAHLLRQWSSRVVYFANDVGEPDAAALRLFDAIGVRVEPRPVRRMVIEHDVLTGVELEDRETVPVGVVFTGPTPVPRDELLRAAGAMVGDDGWIVVDADFRTSLPGVFAAGNVSDVRSNVSVSLGQGSLVAGAINLDLLRDDAKHVLERR